MANNRNYQLGLLYFVHLLISSDGVVSENERRALLDVKVKEAIHDDLFKEFNATLSAKNEKEIYDEGIALLNQCDEEEKLKVFVHLYKISEADGNVHVKEVRLLLYSIKMTGIEFNDVVDKAKK